MHIWVMSNEFETSRIIGGLGIVATQLTHRLIEMGHEVTVLTNYGQEGVLVNEHGSLRIIHFPVHSDFYCRLRRKNRYRPIVAWLEEQKLELPDVIHIHSVSFSNLACYFRKTKGIPVVYTCHSLISHESRIKTKALLSHLTRQRRLLETADQIITPSKWQSRTLVAEYPVCKGKVHTIENGVEQRQEATTQPKTRMLFVGRLNRKKGIEEMLAALSILAKQNPAVRLDIAGRSNRLYHARLVALIKKMGITRHVKMLGFVPPQQLTELYSKYGAVVVPSKQESFGLVALEALASGVPLVSTRSGGLAQFVTSEVAQVITTINGSGIARAVRTMWRQSATTKKRVERGFTVAKQFDWKNIAVRYVDVFHTLTKNTDKSNLEQNLPVWGDEDDD